MTSPIQGAVVSALEIRLSLPEDAYDISVQRPGNVFRMEELPREVAPRSFDIFGRPVVVLRALDPVLPAQDSRVRISYRLGWFGTTRKALGFVVTAVLFLGSFMGLLTHTGDHGQPGS